MTLAIAAIGTKFRAEFWPDGGLLIDVDEVQSLSGPELSAEEIDVTNLDSVGGFKEYLTGIKDAGTASIEVNWVASLGQTTLRAAAGLVNQVSRLMVLEFSDGTTFVCPGVVSGFSMSGETASQLKATYTIRFTGRGDWFFGPMPNGYTFGAGTEIDLSPSLDTSKSLYWKETLSPERLDEVTSDGFFETIGETALAISSNPGSGGVVCDVASGFTPFTLNDDDAMTCWVWIDNVGTTQTTKIRIEVSTDNFASDMRCLTDLGRGCRPGWNIIQTPPFKVFGSPANDRRGADNTGAMGGWEGTNYADGVTVNAVRILIQDSWKYHNGQHLVFCGLTVGQTMPGIVSIQFDDIANSIATVKYDNLNGMGSVSVLERIQKWNEPGPWNSNTPVQMNAALPRIRGQNMTDADLQAWVDTGYFEVNTHGSAVCQPVALGGVFPTMYDALNEGYPDGPTTYDGARYNKEKAKIFDNLSDGIVGEGSAGIYVFPTNRFTANDAPYNQEVIDLYEPYFDALGTNKPYPNIWNKLSIKGDQRISWNNYGRMMVEEPAYTSSYQNLRNRLLFDLLPNQGGWAPLVMHNILDSNAPSDTPVGGSQIHRDKAAYLIDEIAAAVQAGNCICELPSTVFKRLYMSGAGATLK